MAADENVWVDPWVGHEAYGETTSARTYGEILLRRVLGEELPADKSEREKLAVAALQAATWVQKEHGPGSQWNPSLLRSAFKRRRRVDGEHISVTVGDEFIERRRQYERRQQERHGWIFRQNAQHVFAFAFRGGLPPGQHDALLRILLQTPVADEADKKARLRVRRLYEATPTQEIEAMWQTMRLDMLEAEVSQLRSRDESMTAMHGALVDAVANLGRGLMKLERGGDELPDWDELVSANGIAGGGQLDSAATHRDWPV